MEGQLVAVLGMGAIWHQCTYRQPPIPTLVACGFEMQTHCEERWH